MEVKQFLLSNVPVMKLLYVNYNSSAVCNEANSINLNFKCCVHFPTIILIVIYVVIKAVVQRIN